MQQRNKTIFSQKKGEFDEITRPFQKTWVGGQVQGLEFEKKLKKYS